MATAQPDTTLCPIALVQRIIGERWTLQILNEIFTARGRFDEIEAQLGVTSIMLNERLRKLVAEGLIERQLYNPRPARYEFVLTEKGRALFPVMTAVRAWGEAWCKPDQQDPAVGFRHDNCGHIAGYGLLCEGCGEAFDSHSVEVEFLPAYAAERAARQDAFRERRHAKHPLKRPPKPA
jgi:DNA-binding HxlR family transcriptional regulator